LLRASMFTGAGPACRVYASLFEGGKEYSYECISVGDARIPAYH
jgi:hypothetical protein